MQREYVVFENETLENGRDTENEAILTGQDLGFWPLILDTWKGCTLLEKMLESECE